MKCSEYREETKRIASDKSRWAESTESVGPVGAPDVRTSMFPAKPLTERFETMGNLFHAAKIITKLQAAYGCPPHASTLWSFNITCGEDELHVEGFSRPIAWLCAFQFRSQRCVVAFDIDDTNRRAQMQLPLKRRPLNLVLK